MATIIGTDGFILSGVDVAEGTPASFDVAFLDENAAAYTPSSTITMRVYDGTGTLLETGSAITAASTIEVTTTGTANSITGGELRRLILLEWTAVTTRFASPGVKQRCEIDYSVRNFISVS